MSKESDASKWTCCAATARGFVWFWRQILGPFLCGVNWLLLVCFFFAGLAAVCLVSVHFMTKTGQSPPAWLQSVADCILGFFGTNMSRVAKDNEAYAAAVSDLIAGCAFAFAMLPSLQAIAYVARRRRELQKLSGVEIIPVKKAGIDDIRTMLKYYRDAEQLTIFCGHFNWVAENSKLEKQLLGLADESNRGNPDEWNLKLISYRTEPEVRSAFEGIQDKDGLDLFNRLKHCFRFNSRLGPGVKCSLIRKKGRRVLTFLYKWDTDQGDSSNASVRTGGGETRELMDILDGFANKRPPWGEPPSGRNTVAAASVMDDDTGEES